MSASVQLSYKGCVINVPQTVGQGLAPAGCEHAKQNGYKKASP